MNKSPAQPDPWMSLRKLTAARIAIGRAGGSLPTSEVLAFAMDHAEARDAVAVELDVEALEKSLSPIGLPVVRLATEAADRADYLRHPDHGRRLDSASAGVLEKLNEPDADVA